ncbi:hypothetical protein [Vibrio hepatarius]|uniref:hypothetical protein n=1 Tax=Vibrio hepatarius TaxID=171383 RepID=UPI003735CC3F
MSRYIFSILIFSLCSFSFATQAETISAEIIGNSIKWNNANKIGNQVVQVVWQSSSSYNLQKIKEWSPLLVQPSNLSIQFRPTNSSNNYAVTVPVSLTGLQFQSNDEFEISKNSTLSNAYPLCQRVESSNGYVSLADETGKECGGQFSFISKERYMPFHFFRSGFKFNSDELSKSFKDAPAGNYQGSITVPIRYLVKYGATHSFRTFSHTVHFSVRYKPSFLSSVSIIGNGVFDLDYDTNKNSVRGSTDFSVNVEGYLRSGLLMTFESDGVKEDFALKHDSSTSRIPYNLECNMCLNPYVVTDGKLNIHGPSKVNAISSNNIHFKLNFHFNDVSYGSVNEGKYTDSVIIRFEPEL